jgi:hypothetical protein
LSRPIPYFPPKENPGQSSAVVTSWADSFMSTSGAPRDRVEVLEPDRLPKAGARERNAETTLIA